MIFQRRYGIRVDDTGDCRSDQDLPDQITGFLRHAKARSDGQHISLIQRFRHDFQGFFCQQPVTRHRQTFHHNFSQLDSQYLPCIFRRQQCDKAGPAFDSRKAA